jgi:glutamine synthetase
VQWIDLFLFDLNGVPRGKRLRRSDLLGVAAGGIMLPASVFIMDPRGNCVEETGRLWETGDPDRPCLILAGTLAPVPVNGNTHAQAVISLEGSDDLDPRGVLARQVVTLQAKARRQSSPSNSNSM